MTVKALRAVEGVQEVVVVADGCSDRTAEEARAAGARVLVPPARMGKGGALEGAVDRLPPAAVYLLVDGDVGETAGAAASLLEPVRAGELDMAVGRLPPSRGGGFGAVKGLSRWLVGRACGFRAEEPISGQRALTGEVLAACRPLAPGFGVDVSLTIDAVRLGFRVGEVPVRMSHRRTGRTPAGFAHRAGQGLDVLRAVLPRLLGLR
jgi:hypothetical protein